MKRLRTVVPLMLVLIVIGCSKNSESVVLAKVNRAKITVGDFKKQIEDLPPQMQHAVATDPQARKDFLDDLIGIELVLQEARRQGMDKDAQFKKRQDLFKKEMGRRIQEEAKNDLFNNLLKKEIGNKVPVPTDQEVKEYYNKHRDEIRKLTGKDLTLKQAEAQGLKNYVYQKKQREVYIEYAKGLRVKAKVAVDDKALDSLPNALSQPAAQSGLQLQPPSVQGKGTK